MILFKKIIIILIVGSTHYLDVNEKNIKNNNHVGPILGKNSLMTQLTKQENIQNVRDTLPPVLMGTLKLSDEFTPLLFVAKNIGINIFKFTASNDGNIFLNGFVAAGTNGKMLYTRLVKNGKTINEKTCGSGNPLYNGSFNYSTSVKAGDKLSIQILVNDDKWQLHCCPDLYSCTYIFVKSTI